MVPNAVCLANSSSNHFLIIWDGSQVATGHGGAALAHSVCPVYLVYSVYSVWLAYLVCFVHA